jgi:probable F420-dependent oxidoreductase
MRSFRFNVVATEWSPRAQWQELARKVEGMGYAGLVVSDHLGRPSPLARLVSAADATTTLRVGTRVLTTDFHHPLRLAQEASTVDQLTDGRLELGLGAGWARAEYDALGIQFDAIESRAARLDNALTIITKAWADPTTWCGAGDPSASPDRSRPELMVGGQSDAVLAVAARHADVIGLTGARMAGGGEFRPARVAPADISERIGFLRRAAGARFGDIQLSIRVMIVMMGDAPGAAVAEVLSGMSGVPAEVIVASPYAFIGTTQEVVDKVLAARELFGITGFDVQAGTIDDLGPVIDAVCR